jgi:hypothetical protein
MQFSFTELHITPADLEELMGFEPDFSPEPFPELIDQALRLAPGICQITGGYQIFNHAEVDLQNGKIRIEGLEFSPGKIVVARLKEAEKAALYVATAGAEISLLARQKADEGNELMAYVLDITGSVTVDRAAGKVKESIYKEASLQGMAVTDSFSPGYCEWSVAEQQKLFSLLPPGFCGISLSGSSLMHPIKSVSGIVGLGINCKQNGYQCNWCPDEQCIYGKIRRLKRP